MKKYFFLILLYLSTHLYAQEYHPLIEDNKIWTVEFNDYIVLPPETWQSTYEYQKDTIIDMISYSYFFNGSILREDIPNKKVYVRDEGYMGNECLLYDFDAQAGDVLDVCSFEITIDSVSTIVIGNGEERKIFYYQGTVTGEYYIEGIGSNHGLIYLSEPIGPPNIEFMCLQQDGVELYGERCDEANAIYDNIEEQELTAINIYPNPTNHSIKIEADLHITSYKIMDNIGRYVEQNIVRGNSIELSNLQRGVYIVEFFDDQNKMISRKRFVYQ